MTEQQMTAPSAEEALASVKACVQSLAEDGRQRVVAARESAEREMHEYHESKEKLEDARRQLVKLRGLTAAHHSALVRAQLEENEEEIERLKASYRDAQRRIGYLKGIEKDCLAVLGADDQVRVGLRSEERRRDAGLAAISPIDRLGRDIQKLINEHTAKFRREVEDAVQAAASWREDIRAREWDRVRFGPEENDKEAR